MGFTIDIDTGGTCTDGLVNNGSKSVWVKTDTTPNDLTIAFNKCLELASKEMGFSSIDELLEDVDIIRWSNTIATNVIAEKTGPKLGMFVSEGYETTLYGNQSSPALDRLIDPSNIVGIKQPVESTEILLSLKEILAKGVRRIVICLKDSFYDNSAETTIQNIIYNQFPEHYLGSVPILSGEDICKHPDDMTRAHAALLNAYVHGPMATSLFNEEDFLRSKGYVKPLLIGHIDGGVARVSKTKPIDTIESGPIFGIHGSAYFAQLYDLNQVITLDVGGTTSKVGWIDQKKPVLSHENAIFDVPIRLPFIHLSSIALGGGTVAKADSKGSLSLGPKSMGAYPGPACYGLGGTEATITDAFLMLGYLNPSYFFGGGKDLDPVKAEDAIKAHLAEPLNTSVEMAALQVIHKACDNIADAIGKSIKTDNDLSSFSLFSFGGNGGLFGCLVADKLNIDTVYYFSVGPLLSAFGSSIADISHTYEFAPFCEVQDTDGLSKIVNRLKEQALRDMEGEGLNLKNVEMSMSLQVSDGKNTPIVIDTDFLQFESSNDVKVISGLFDERAPSHYDRDKIVIEVLRIIAKHPSPKRDIQIFSLQSDQTAVEKGSRTLLMDNQNREVPLYDWESVAPGNQLVGPVMIEGAYTNYLIPSGWELYVDQYKNCKVTKRR